MVLLAEFDTGGAGDRAHLAPAHPNGTMPQTFMVGYRSPALPIDLCGNLPSRAGGAGAGEIGRAGISASPAALDQPRNRVEDPKE